MADEFFGPPTNIAADVPAEIQSNGSVTEDGTGEVVGSEAGNAAWYNTNYPGQITSTSSTTVDTSTLTAEQLAVYNLGRGISTPVNPATLSPKELEIYNLGQGISTPVNPSALSPGEVELYNLGRGISTPVNPSALSPKELEIYNLGQGNASAINPSTLTAEQLAVYNLGRGVATSVDPASLTADQLAVYNLGKGIATTSPASPTQDAYGLNILNAEQTAQLTSKINPAFINGVAPTVNTGADAAIAAANKQIASDAARLNAQSPNPYLTNIDQAAAEISKGQEGIATANQTIQSATQKIVDSESYIAQNNAELADPNISAERRAILEANNAAQVQNVSDQTQSINENQAYIANTQEIIQFNQAIIDTNTAGYRATTSGANVPVVEVNSDPNFVGPQQITATVINPTTGATAVDPANTGFTPTAGAATTAFFGSNPDAEQEASLAAEVGRIQAQKQAVLAAQKRVANNSDWRVRLQLAPGANYLYNAPTGPNGAGPGILWPLKQTDGVIFPYTPKIQMNYKADYEPQVLTHSNYKGYFYKSSYADAVSLNAVFTAQDTSEAQYLLAVIHFFRAVTKMFYGQDPNRGAPPPMVYLTGLGEFQFTQHPCVVANFNYSLPSDVDYIRARSTNINGTNLLTRRDRQSLPTNPISGAVGRLQSLFSSQGINKGALFYPPPTTNLGQNQPTYVPTRMEIDLTLYPIQSRQQVSRVFDNRQYNNGAQLKGGFW